MTRAQDRLAVKHGTPQQFKDAIQKAYDDGFIKRKEASAAVRKYWDEWHKAGEDVPLNHVGLYAERLDPEQKNPREVAFTQVWRNDNIGKGKGGSAFNTMTTLIPGCSQRDATVAATIIQWLGSNVGMAFLDRVANASPEVAQEMKTMHGRGG